MRSEREQKNPKQLDAAGKLSAPVAHDINNLLSGILGYCDLISGEPAAEHLKSHIEEISNAAKRMASMARMLLVFTRKGIAQPEMLNASDIIGEIEQFIIHLAGPRIEFAASEEPALWHVRVDSAQLKRALLTLAIGFGELMPKGGKFVLETKNLVLVPNEMRNCPDKPGNYVLITGTAKGDMEVIPAISGRITLESAEQFDKKTRLGISDIFDAIRICGGEMFLDKTATCEIKIHMYFSAITSNPKT